MSARRLIADGVHHDLLGLRHREAMGAVAGQISEPALGPAYTNPFTVRSTDVS